MMRTAMTWTALGLSLPLLVAASPQVTLAQSRIDFAREIRPILSENCFRCHGPDVEERKAKLRLDIKEGAFGKLRGGGHAIVPGSSAKSELIARITATDPSERMPPAKVNKHLTPQQIALLRQWIDQGAEWSEHWAFVPPQRPALPRLKSTGWARNALDHFISARLEKEGLRPSPEADRVTLIRRLTLDLTGLPPTLREVDDFVADANPGAYDKVVDRLLASPHYGERLAVDWLDAARYADTHGYHIDAGRDMTRWRDWVIDAFNQNLPFDRFTIEQLAGDLLPKATLQQKIASGFNRNHMINFEGGAIPQEYHNAYIVDRVNTTGTVWLGLSVACAQCHDHKYDPISQKEFYQLYAFFHNVPENGLDGSRGNAAPLLKAPTRIQQRRLDEIAVELKSVEKQLAAPMPAVDAAQAEWEKVALTKEVAWQLIEIQNAVSQGGATLTRLADKSIVASGLNPANDSYTVTAKIELPAVRALRLEALPDARFTANGPGRSVNGNIVLTSMTVRFGPKPIKIKSASADFSQKAYPIANAIDADPQTGWAIHPQVGQAHQAVFEFAEPIKTSGTLSVTLDFRSQFGQHQLGRFRLYATTASDPHGTSTLPANIQQILRLSPAARSVQQKAELRRHYRTQVSPAVKRLRERLAYLQQEKVGIEKSAPNTMVMAELPQPRDTFMLIRGQYDKRGEKVHAAVPAALPPLPRGAPANRLGLAKWLVDSSNPLTARVAVNRYWQMFFGTGLVRTAADFGSQGEQPSHPELLDWLAVEFMQPSRAPLGTGSTTAWDIRALVRLIVTSSTYRQSSRVTPELLARDRENRLLARGPRLRLQAEFIRDQALAVSGLLNQRIGGASVFPYQPAGLWQELASRTDSKNWSAQFFTQSHGQDLYRRSMYTFWKRTSPPPQMITFDAPDREVCTVRRSTTNTPLQALVLMNDPTYVEASRKLAERMMTSAKTADQRIIFAFRLATARRPSKREVTVLKKVFDKQLAIYRQDRNAALRLLASGEAPRNRNLDPAELAAWSIVASVVLNLDETVAKG